MYRLNDKTEFIYLKLIENKNVLNCLGIRYQEH